MQVVLAASECTVCKQDRKDRHRVLSNWDNLPHELRQTPFSEAPAIYGFNVPRYHSLQLRAREYAKQQNKQLSWCYAKDVPLHPGDLELSGEKLDQKRSSWLNRHEQDTSQLTSLLPLARDMPVRLTDTIDRSRQMYRGRRGFIHAWTFDPLTDAETVGGEYLLDRLPSVI